MDGAPRARMKQWLLISLLAVLGLSACEDDGEPQPQPPDATVKLDSGEPPVDPG